MLAVIIVCIGGTQAWQCQRDPMHSRAVITHQTAATLLYPCLEEAQQYAAMGRVTSRMVSGDYLKIGCEPGHGQPTDDHL